MRKIIYVFILGLIAASCSSVKPDIIEVSDYFDLDSLMISQVDLLSQSKSTLAKTVWMDGESETREFVPDSASWANELRFLSQLDINKPRLVGAYEVTPSEKGSKLRYVPKFNKDLPVQYLEIANDEESVSVVKGKLVEQNDIYKTSFEATLTFDQSRLSDFHIKGYQKMVLKDSVFYEIKGIVKE